MAEEKRYPGQSTEVFPEPFNKPLAVIPTGKPGQLAEEKIKQFFDEGFLVVEDFFTPEELQPCRDAIEKMVDVLADKLYKAGKVKNLYKDSGLFQRLTMLEKEFQGANILLFKHQKMPEEFRNLWCNERILNLIEQIIGPDISGHPVWNMRTKTPLSAATNIPWHQDSGYFSNESYDHMVPTAWIPFLDATEENGCMVMARYGHKKGKVADHTCCAANTWYITLEEEEMRKTLGVDLEKDIINCPVKYGGFVLFHNITPHRSLPNVSNDIRWSIDLRWQSPHENWGFYGIQEGVEMRSSKNPNVIQDWDKFLSVDRKEVWQEKFRKQAKQTTDPFDTTVTGPWIGQWKIVNQNQHTRAYERS
ncbi:hypothetical protein ScPMuIL_009860 [Solemya velum]